MKRLGFVAMMAVGLMETAARAQSSLEMLEKDIEQLKQEHQAATSKNLDYFLTTLSDASSSAENADKLYLAAGGKPPDPAKVKTAYEHETPTEAAAREAIDQQTMANFDGTLQLHCGMMRLAALFITDPKSPNLQNDWLTWLKNAAQNYPQLEATVTDTRATPDDDKDGDGHHHHHAEESGEGPDPSAELRKLSMSQSPISNYLGFHGWGDKDQGKWSVSDVPDLYRKQILEPLRQTPSPATLAAWDVYIAMKNADQPDQDQWTSVDLPALQFDKDSDDFASAPSTEKLETLVGIIKANPEHPLQDEWFKRVQDMLKTFQGQRDGGAAAAPEAALPPIQPDAPTAPSVVYPTNSPPATPKP